MECDNPEEGPCVTLLCLGDACGFYRCEDMPSDVELARFPPAAAPGSGPRRNWGGAGKLPGGAVMVFPNWNGGPERIIPPFTPAHGRALGEAPHLPPGSGPGGVVRGARSQDSSLHHAHPARPPSAHPQPRRKWGPWNQAWRDYMRGNQRATPEEIYKHAGELIYRFQLLGGPIQPYYSRPGT